MGSTFSGHLRCNRKFGFNSAVAEFIPQVAALSGALVCNCEIQHRGRRINFYFGRGAGNRAEKNIQTIKMNPALEKENDLAWLQRFCSGSI